MAGEGENSNLLDKFIRKNDKYVIFDYVFSPSDKIKLDYKGPNPFRVYGMIPKLLQIHFHGRGKNIFERQFKWDITSDPRDFYFQFVFGDVKIDRFTGFEIKIKVFGAQPSDPNDPNGLFYIEVKPEITTTYEFHNTIEKMFAMPFIWAYHKLIYSKMRRRHMQRIKRWTFNFVDDIRKEFGIEYELKELMGAGKSVP